MLLRQRLANPGPGAVTPVGVAFSRRQLLWAGAGAAGTGLAPAGAAHAAAAEPEPLTAQADATGYNNYYEFSTDKKAVRILAQALEVRPWTVTVEGEVEKPFVLDLDSATQLFGSEERVYRLRCVEGWSMVIPWSGFPLRRLIERARPLSSAKFVEFVSLHRPSEMIGQRAARPFEWPYREGLRIDEATHPLTLATIGMYGAPLPRQNGGPFRVVVPWKYGFKSPKAVTHIRLVASMPVTSWNRLSPSEYGFYGNVNPEVPHPRWPQSREVRVGELRKRPTAYLNGYASEVAGLYAGMQASALY